MGKVVITHNGVTFTVREKVGRDSIEHTYILSKLVEDIQGRFGGRDNIADLEWALMSWYVGMFQRTDVSDPDNKLWFEWPNRETYDGLVEAYDATMEGDFELVEKLKAALQESNKEIIDPEDSPAAQT